MRIQSKTIVAAVLLLATAISLTAQQPLSTEYRIGPKDLLEVTAMGVPEINKFVVRVSEDGKITLPLLGEVDVNNLTRSEVEKKLVAILGEKYLVNPQVTVFIQEYKSKQVSVLGAVEKPGPYELLGRQTVLSIISQAGGMTRDAGNEIIVIRQLPDGTSTSVHISVDDLFFKGDAKLNIPLEPNDIVTIPVEKIVVIYVFGQVKNPGALQVKKSSIPTLLQAIAQAGGFSDRASKGNIKIRRKDAAGKDIEITVNAKDILKGKIKNDVPLLENDTVYVPESLF
jgi:polysaccharide export outer membrane protein